MGRAAEELQNDGRVADGPDSSPAAKDFVRLQERHDLLGEIAAAIQEATAVKIGLFVALERATSYFGDELVLDVSPQNLIQQLRFRIDSDNGEERVCDYFLGTGPWPDHLLQISESLVFREVAEIAANGKMPKESGSYKRFIKRLGKGHPVVRNRVVLDSVEMIDAYFANIEGLIRNIRGRGVERRAGFDFRQVSQLETSVVRPLASEVVERDVGVGLGANGDLIRVCAGAHRTAAARVLGLASIPVELCLIHVEFLAKIMAQTKSDPIEAVLYCVRHAGDTYRYPRTNE